MDLKQYCLDAVEKVTLLIAKKWDTPVSNMLFQCPVGCMAIIIYLYSLFTLKLYAILY